MPPDWPNKPVDGYDRKRGIIYEYLGDYYHGHPSLWGTRGGVAYGPDKRNGKIKYRHHRNHSTATSSSPSLRYHRRVPSP